MFPQSRTVRRGAGLITLAAGAFAPGRVSSNLLGATGVNAGLVVALNQVSQNLFGRNMFGASVFPTGPFYRVKLMKKIIPATLFVGSLLISASVIARTMEFAITNLTNGMHFTPILVSIHGEGNTLFENGTRASDALQAMAEGGALSGLIAEVEANDNHYVANPAISQPNPFPAPGLLPPGQTTTGSFENIKLNKKDQRYLSVVAMIMPTNDGFMGINSLELPTKNGTYTYYLNAYDAGTESNDEIINGGGAPGVPGIPMNELTNFGTGATGADGAIDALGNSPGENSLVHPHPGIIGDTDPTGGISDLDLRYHRFTSPVAKLVLRISN